MRRARQVSTVASGKEKESLEVELLFCYLFLDIIWPLHHPEATVPYASDLATTANKDILASFMPKVSGLLCLGAWGILGMHSAP